MSPHDQARAIFRAIRYDDAAIAIQRAAYIAAAAALTTADGAIQITSSQVNGQSFDAKHTSTPKERFQVLSILIGMIERDAAGTKSTVGRFR